jgi:hypothetical protein
MSSDSTQMFIYREGALDVHVYIGALQFAYHMEAHGVRSKT